MAYEDDNPASNPFSSPATQGPIQTSQPEAVIPTGPGGHAGTWGGFHEENTTLTTSSTDPSTSNPFISSQNTTTTASSGLFAGMTIDGQESESSEFVSLNAENSNLMAAPGNAGSWVELEDDKVASTDKTIDVDGEMDRTPTDKEQIIADKMAYMPFGCKTMFVLFETPVAIHWSFVLVLVANFVYAIVYYKEFSIYSVMWSLLAGIFWFLFVLVNQIAHVIAAKVWGVRTTVAVCWMFGGLRDMVSAQTTWEQIRVSISGPISHLPWIVLFGFAATVLGHAEGVDVCYCVYLPFKNHFGFNIMNYCLWQNIWLFGWNLFLPCYPLDGSLIMTCFLINRGFTPDRVLAIMLRISGVCFVGCGLWAFFTRHLWAFISSLFLLWNILNMCWYLGRAEKHPLFGLQQTAEQIADDDMDHANELAGKAASSVAMHAIRSQASSPVNQNNAWTAP